MEHRSHKGTIEIRAADDGSPIIAGYAAVFNRDSSDLGFIEQVDPRAFDKTLREADVRGLGNHQADWLLGRSKAGTLRLAADSVGLRYEIDVNVNDPDGLRALEKVKRGDMDGSSFSFQTIRDEWNWDMTPPQRRLLEVALVDVGPVTYPAYPDATASARALDPIAAKVGRPVDELVAAMKTGEIRSLLNPKETAVPDEAVAPVEAHQDEIETRAGARLSASSMTKIHDAMNALRELLGGDDDGDDDENLVDQALEMDSADPVAGGRAAVTDIEVAMRMRELQLRADDLAA